GKKYRLCSPQGSGSLIGFNKTGCCILKSCRFVNAKSGIYRLKVVHLALVMNREFEADVLQNDLPKIVKPNTVTGVFEAPTALARATTISGQLQSLYLSPSVHETTIGSFLSRHPTLLTTTLGASDHVYEPTLPWIDKPPGVER